MKFRRVNISIMQKQNKEYHRCQYIKIGEKTGYEILTFIIKHHNDVKVRLRIMLYTL